MNATTTFPKAKLAEIKKREGAWIAKDIMTEINWSSGLYPSRDYARFFAAEKVEAMTTRQVTMMLKDCGYSFNPARAIWQAAQS